jgi:hypothetical protein
VRTFPALMIIVAVLGAVGVNSADACYFGACRYRSANACQCSTTSCSCQQQCCVVMKRCPEVVYEEHEVTAYKTEYVQVVDKKEVPAVKYVEEVQYLLRPMTIWQPQPCECGNCSQPGSCAPVKACEAVQPPKLCPVTCLQKVPNTVLKPVSYQKVEENPRVEIKQVPYKVICYTAKTVYKEVPVTVCCPAPCCKTSCCEER